MAASLASSRHDVERAIREAQHVWLGLDFDGTLAPIEDHPETVQLSPRTREVLRLLSIQDGVSVAIISGRELRDVQSRVALDSLAYSGNHGVEIEGPNLIYISPQASAMRDDVSGIAETIRVHLAHVDRLLVENKRLSLSVHYRLVSPVARREVREVVDSVVQNYPSFRVHPGAMVWDVRPCLPASKGTAALWLKEHQAGPQALPIFIGDDVTDEDALRAFPDGITIKVGAHRPTCARYAVADHKEVVSFLCRLASLRFADGF